MNDLVDLHVHSNKSCDGDFPPADLIRLAKDEGFRAMTRLLVPLAERHAEGRLAAVLEGGYDLRALQTAVPAVLDELEGAPASATVATPRPRSGILDATRAAQRPFWNLR